MRHWPLILLLAIATRLPALGDRIYSNDEATYSALAARIVHGGSMYVDAVDHKPPAIVTLYADVFAVAGPYRLASVRALLVLVVGLTGIAVGELAVLLTGDPRTCMAGVLYVLASATGFPDNVQPANTELFLNLPLTIAAIAAVAATSARSTPRALVLGVTAGALTGGAALFKYQAALAGLAWLWAAWTVRSRPRLAVAMASGLALGFCAVAVALITHYERASRLEAFYFWGWRYNFAYIASMPLPRQATRAIVRSVMTAVFWAPLFVLVERRPGRLSPEAVTVAVWLGAMALAVTTGGRYFGNYYLMLLPPLAVLASLKPVPRLAIAATSGLAAFSLAAATFWPALRPGPTNEDLRYRQAGAWVRDHSSPGDRLFVWGDSAQVYAYSNRLMGTRFAFSNYHTGKIWGTGADADDAAPRPDLIVPRAWDELLEDFHRAPPELLVDAAAGGLHGFSGHGLDRYPALWSIVQADYRRVDTVAGMPIYQRVTGTR
jgi:hypothetical protein